MKKIFILSGMVLASMMILCACDKASTTETDIVSQSVSEQPETAVDEQEDETEVMQQDDGIEEASESTEQMQTKNIPEITRERTSEEDRGSEGDVETIYTKVQTPGEESVQQNIIDYDLMKDTFQSILELRTEEAGASLKTASATLKVMRLANSICTSSLDSSITAPAFAEGLSNFSEEEKDTILNNLQDIREFGNNYFGGDELTLGTASDAGVASEMDNELSNEYAYDNWVSFFDAVMQVN